eukprot:scpid50838/ scgid19135/ 
MDMGYLHIHNFDKIFTVDSGIARKAASKHMCNIYKTTDKHTQEWFTPGSPSSYKSYTSDSVALTAGGGGAIGFRASSTCATTLARKRAKSFFSCWNSSICLS